MANPKIRDGLAGSGGPAPSEAPADVLPEAARGGPRNAAAARAGNPDAAPHGEDDESAGRCGAARRFAARLRARAKTHPKRRAISEVLEDLKDNWTAEKVSVRELLTALGDRGHALIMLVLALPNLVPVPLPIASIVTGVPLVLISGQAAFGYKTPVLPRFVLDFSMRHTALAQVLKLALPRVRWIERFLQPRFGSMTQPGAIRAAFIICMTMGCLVTIPLPWTNMMPAIAIAVFCVALIERDGVLVLAACCAGLLIATGYLTVAMLGMEGAHQLLDLVLGTATR